MTRLELAAIRLYRSSQADRERSRKMSSSICEREGDPFTGKQNRPCWKSRVEFLDDGTVERLWPSACGEDEGNGHPDSWCQSCQNRQKLYLDKSVRKELGNAKRSFWAATKAMLRELQGGYL